MSIENYKEIICKRCREFSESSLYKVKFFIEKDLLVDEKYLNQNSDGIRINLDNLDDELIVRLYKYIDELLELELIND